MRPLTTLIVALFLVGSCNCNKCPAQSHSTGGVVQFDPSKKVNGHNDYRHGQVIDFPTGNDRLHLTVVVSRQNFRDPRNQKIANWFAAVPVQGQQAMSSNPRLRKVQQACGWHYMFDDDPNFSQTARIELLGNSDLPLVMLTGPNYDPKIKRDGSGGLLMYGTDLQSINNADDMADYLIAAADGFNQKPALVGLVDSLLAPTPTVSVPAGGTYCPSCGIPTGGGDCPNCTPAKPQPNSGTTPAKLTTVMPNPRKAYDAMYATGIGILGAFGIAGLGGIGLLLRFKKRA